MLATLTERWHGHSGGRRARDGGTLREALDLPAEVGGGGAMVPKQGGTSSHRHRSPTSFRLTMIESCFPFLKLATIWVSKPRRLPFDFSTVGRISDVPSCCGKAAQNAQIKCVGSPPHFTARQMVKVFHEIANSWAGNERLGIKSYVRGGVSVGDS